MGQLESQARTAEDYSLGRPLEHAQMIDPDRVRNDAAQLLLVDASTQSHGVVSDFLQGVQNAPRSHMDGIKQAFGAKVDLDYLANENTAQKVGHLVGDLAIYGVTAAVLRNAPVGAIGEKYGAIAAGAALGFSTPIQDNGLINRGINTLIGGATMSILPRGDMLDRLVFAPGGVTIINWDPTLKPLDKSIGK